MNVLTKIDFRVIVLAADIGALLPINYINITILTQGGVTLFENNLFIITAEVIGTVALTALNVAWLLKKFRTLARKKPAGIL
jgi:formylmethanofuran dehydrogenase subunit A